MVEITNSYLNLNQCFFFDPHNFGIQSQTRLDGSVGRFSPTSRQLMTIVIYCIYMYLLIFQKDSITLYFGSCHMI